MENLEISSMTRIMPLRNGMFETMINGVYSEQTFAVIIRINLESTITDWMCKFSDTVIIMIGDMDCKDVSKDYITMANHIVEAVSEQLFASDLYKVFVVISE